MGLLRKISSGKQLKIMYMRFITHESQVEIVLKNHFKVVCVTNWQIKFGGRQANGNKNSHVQFWPIHNRISFLRVSRIRSLIYVPYSEFSEARKQKYGHSSTRATFFCGFYLFILFFDQTSRLGPSLLLAP